MGRGGDRISELPDTIRLQILSLLPRKFAVRTGVLSRRWQELWRYRWPYITILDFGDEFVQGLAQEELAKSINQFLGIRGDKKVEIFRLFFDPCMRYQSDIVSWLEYAIVNGVEELYLDLSRGITVFQVPDCVFNGASLTVLNLKHCDLGFPLDFKRLNLLETLSLQCVNVTDELVLDVIASCPLLERLDLRQCPELRSIKVCGIDLRLRSVTVVDCWKACEIEIFARNLLSFHFNGEFLQNYVFREISSLEDAMMSSAGREAGLCQANWVKIIQELSHVKVLTLCSRAIQQIAVSKESRPIVLRNLQELQLLMDLMTETNLSDILGFFRKCHCPNLEKVFIELPTGTKDPSVKTFLKVAAEEPLECDFGHLKTVKMNSFKGHKNEVDLVMFFLENAIALDSMVLVASEDIDPVLWSQSGTKMSLNFPHRASPNAKLVLCVASEDSSGLCPTHCDVYCKV